jgi:hypothetical protein
MQHHTDTKNPNNITASNFILLAFGLAILNFIFRHHTINLRSITFLLFTILLNISIAMLIRKGIPWMKWFMLIWVVLGLVSTGIRFPQIIKEDFLVCAISIAQTLIWSAALVFMFNKPKDYSTVNHIS